MTQTFEIVGMTCNSCRSHDEESPNSVGGVVDIVVDLEKNTAIIEIDLYIAQMGVPIIAEVLFPAFGLLLSPLIVALVMSFNSVSVIANALRLRSIKF